VHEGSLGNLCNDKIVGMMQVTVKDFEFEKIHIALEKLLSIS